MTETHHAPLPDEYPSSRQPTSSIYSRYKKLFLPLIGLFALVFAYTTNVAKPVSNSLFMFLPLHNVKSPKLIVHRLISL